MLAPDVPLLARTPEEIKAEARCALAVHRGMIAEGDMDEARRIEAHVAAYMWLLGDADVAPVTSRRVPVLTARDLAIEQDEGRDHAEQNIHRTTPGAALPGGRLRPSPGRAASSSTPVGLPNRGA